MKAGPSLRQRPAIIALAPNEWHGEWMNRQQLLSRLARRGWEIVYSTGPLSVWDRKTEKWTSSKLIDHFEVLDSVSVSRPGRLFPRWPTWPAYDRLVIRRHARALAAHINSSGKRQTIAYVFHPDFSPYVQHFSADFLIYHPYDAFSRITGATPALVAQEKILVATANLVIGSSASIIEQLPKPSTARTIVLENAADFRAFAEGGQTPCPDDLKSVPRPRLGYIGRLTRKIDFCLILEVAKSRPDWHWVLVGPVLESGSSALAADPVIGQAYRQSRMMPNIHFLGMKSYTDLPAYEAHMDVNTMIYRMDEGWWTAGYPLKMHEYLACGRPIVSTPLPEILRFSKVIDFASGKEAWIAALERALAGGVGTPELRREVALANSWDTRVDELEEHLLSLVSRS